MSESVEFSVSRKSNDISTHDARSLAFLKIELLCQGVKFVGTYLGRKGGAGPSGGRYLTLPDGNVVNVPMRGRFVRNSPFKLKKEDEDWTIFREGSPLTKVSLVPIPDFHERRTSDGVPMKKIAKFHGKDCLGTTLLSRCYRFGQGKGCKFCAIERGEDKDTPKKTGQQLVETVIAAKEGGVVEHMTITTGTTSGPDRGALILAEAVREIKGKVNIPIHVQLEPPASLDYLDLLKESGVDTVGIHIETFDEEVRQEICPGKAEISPEEYMEAWSHSVDLFGRMQVSSFLIPGLGQSHETILKGARILAEIGVMPFLVPLRPTPGTPLSRWSPPKPDLLLQIAPELAKIFHDYGLFKDKPKSGCPRCGACGLDGKLLESLSSSEG